MEQMEMRFSSGDMDFNDGASPRHASWEGGAPSSGWVAEMLLFSFAPTMLDLVSTSLVLKKPVIKSGGGHQHMFSS
jgi:hypothetical protein